MNIKEFSTLKPAEREVNWNLVEDELGYKLCDDLKSFNSLKDST
ncbi:hypothetical protein CSC2_09110 [Clostridium zeae]|uniref:Uncharacterized protein n=1 Tax=Clostridium zeae TaxID=2759022 RepID=A0ABQ1E6J8_9CLOT|nr:hypothetical protein [Clostridium zeae]GFZ30385.1 hypothetical protein CSC2_09110 [Clostridium zeae]